MFEPTRTILAMTLLASAGTAVPASPADMNADKVEMLPACAMLAIEKNGQFAIISDSGRFIILGTVYEVWAKKELKSIEDARIAAHYIAVDKTNLGYKDLARLTVGNGDKAITMFSDPACGFCNEIIQQAGSSLPERYRLDVLMLPLLSHESAVRTKELLCAEDMVAAWNAGACGDMKTRLEQLPTAQSDLDVISKRPMTAQFLGARNVTFLIRDDGLTRVGKPEDGLRAWIESNRTL
ncbi:DsbC family protein [Pseudomonas aeruginosa]|uniref:DsbC family protein n=1 Tax=Pseudomonas aeruginosa TaxID=287 RepID=UPI001E53273D|nr:DsbC family protein [Pseudomonas aeruginosa]MCC9289595.1 DsbC family protein [Pseudomonas aeruginosa]UVN18843.1 Thiol,disulfide interchange protein DsbC [Pseudomonas aeruginosa]